MSEDEVRQYWRHHRQHGSRWATYSQASELTMPLGIYGDSVKVRSTYLGVEKMVGVFLNAPLYRPRSCRCSRWLLFSCQEELLYHHHTLDCIFRFLTWSLNHLYTGKYPLRGFNGSPLSERAAAKAGQWVCRARWCFQVCEIRGDWVWHKQVFRFQSSWKAGSKLPICFKCRTFAKGPTHELYYNIEENSPCWSKEYETVADFIAEQLPRPPCHKDGSYDVFSTLWFANSIEIWMIMCPKLHIPIDLADLLAKVLWCFSDSFIRTCCGGARCTR